MRNHLLALAANLERALAGQQPADPSKEDCP
jgi:hypothetical protein